MSDDNPNHIIKIDYLIDPVKGQLDDHEQIKLRMGLEYKLTEAMVAVKLLHFLDTEKLCNRELDVLRDWIGEPLTYK